MRIALATCVKLPEPDPDQEPLLAALREEGAEVDLLPWDDPGAAPDGYDLCVLRSTWNYPLNPDAFLQWLQRVDASTRLLNRLPVVRWNLHKTYLRDLEGKGVRTFPTVWLSRGDAPSLAEIMDETGWDDVVIKPSVSAASFMTRRFKAADAEQGQAFLEALCGERDVMVQKFIEPYEGIGERSLVWIDGEWSHTVAKRPRFADGDEAVSEALEFSEEERSLAQLALAGLEADLLYARADLMRDDEGRLCLSELELVEPSLFLGQAPGSLQRFAEAICRKAQDAS